MAGFYDRTKALAGVVLKHRGATFFVIVLLIAVAIPLYEHCMGITRIHISDPHYPEELAKRGFNAKSFIENVKRELEAIENTDREKVSLAVNQASFDVSIPGTEINVFDFVRSIFPFNQPVYVFPEIINEAGIYKISIGNAERDIPDLILNPHHDTIAALHQAARYSAEDIALYAAKGEALPRVQLAIAYRAINADRPYEKKRYKGLLREVITSTAYLVPEDEGRNRTAAIAYRYLGDIKYNKARRRSKKSLYEDAIRFYDQALGADKSYAGALRAKAKSYRRMCNFRDAQSALDRLKRNNKNGVWTRNQAGLLAKSKALYSKTYKNRRYDIETQMTIARDIFAGLIEKPGFFTRLFGERSFIARLFGKKEDTAIFHYNLGVTLHALGQEQEGNAAFAKAKELNWQNSDLGNGELDNARCKLGLLGRDPASCTAEEEMRCPTG